VLAWYFLSAKPTTAATPSDTWLYTPTAEAGGVSGGTERSPLSGIATALGLAPAALGVLGAATGLAGKAAGLVSGLFGGGAAAAGAVGALPAAETIVGLPVAEYAGSAGPGIPWSEPVGFLKDIIANTLFSAGIPATTTGIGGIAGSMGAAEFAAMEGFQAAGAAGAGGSAVATPLLAYLAPVAAVAAPLSAIIETVFWGYPAEKEAEHKAVEANTGVLSGAPYLVNWIASHPFDQSFSMYWQAMNELPDAQYGEQKRTFQAAREGTPVPAVLTPVAQSTPSMEEVQHVVETAQVRAQLEAGTLPATWTPSTPSEQEAVSQYRQIQALTASEFQAWAGAGEPLGSAGSGGN
jgi:hypothetical protein